MKMHCNLRILEPNKLSSSYRPAPPQDSEHIKKLVYESSPKDTEMLINFIYKRMKNQGILYTLVNRLYEMDPDDICFYVPQIVYLAVKADCQPLIRFLVDRIQLSLNTFTLIYWNVQAFGYHMKQKDSQVRDRLDNLERKIRDKMRNSPWNLEKNPLLRQITVNEELIKVRNDYFVYLSKFIDKLVKTSLHLKTIEEGQRKDKLKAQIIKANQSLRNWALKNKDHKMAYHQGIIIPFSKGKKENFESTLVVNIVQDECSCFNTRKRVPYRIVLETVNMEELARSPVEVFKSQREKTQLSLTDTFIQDIPELQHKVSSTIKITETEENNIKLKELLRQAMDPRVINEQNQNKDGINKRIAPYFASYFSSLQAQAPQSPSQYPQFSQYPQSSQFPSTQQIYQPQQFVPPQQPQPNQPWSPFQQWRQSQQNPLNMSPFQQYMTNMHLQNNRPAISREQYDKNLRIFQMTVGPLNKIKRRNSTGDASQLAQPSQTNADFALKRRQTRVFKDDICIDMRRVRYRSVQKQANTDKQEFIELISNRIKNNPRIMTIHQKLIRQDRANRQNELFQYATKMYGPWQELWQDKVRRFKTKSLYSHLHSYKLRNCIVKGGDDLRQEIVCMQLIQKFKYILEQADSNLYIRPYEIIVLNESSGILEFVTNSISIDALKKNTPNFVSLYEFYKEMFGNQMPQKQRNFVYSLAAYSLLTYILQIKDRHNGNILIDSDGHIIHIDFGFIFCTSPGNLNFQSSPFKLTAEYVEMLQGKHSDLYDLFKSLFRKGFQKLREHIEAICSIVQIMSEDSDLPCFEQFNMAIFRQRFKQHMGLEEFAFYCDSLIEQSCFNWRTAQYDYFQFLSNGIAQ